MLNTERSPISGIFRSQGSPRAQEFRDQSTLPRITRPPSALLEKGPALVEYLEVERKKFFIAQDLSASISALEALVRLDDRPFWADITRSSGEVLSRRIVPSQLLENIIEVEAVFLQMLEGWKTSNIEWSVASILVEKLCQRVTRAGNMRVLVFQSFKNYFMDQMTKNTRVIKRDSTNGGSGQTTRQPEPVGSPTSSSNLVFASASN